MKQQGGAKLHLLTVVDEGRIHSTHAQHGHPILGGEVEFDHLVEDLHVPREIGESFAKRVRRQPDIGERVGIADIDLGREVDAIAVVAKFVGGEPKKRPGDPTPPPDLSRPAYRAALRGSLNSS
jgi:hypothetical protein